MTAAVEAVRDFNRFYTRRIGLLRERLTDSPFTLPEARVLYELTKGELPTAAALTRELGMDKAHLSRLLARLRKRGLVTSRVSPDHAKHRLLSLTAAGRRAYAALERDMVAEMGALLSPLQPAEQARLTGAMADITAIIGGRNPSASTPSIVLRDPRPGDLGFVLHRQAALYAHEYDWDWTFESLAADILAKFIANYDSDHEQAWIAERDGAIVGSVFLMRGDKPDVGKLRLLYVEPSARGLGIGAKLVDACIARAREIGYSRLTLWTNDILVAARRIYQAAGFRLVAEESHHSFGKDLVGQTWDLDLT
jgi:DNA-binding MarR family transcriptional regulator/N-acetylglutamate synthase-like GNAT family acetyltransferase